MRHLRTTSIAACAALALTAAAAGAQTTQDRTTFVTFSGPVSIPGKTLPAGTYTFRLADSQTDRHIVQILDKEGSQLIATMLAVPAERAELDGDPVITFKETPSDQPPAVRYWYYAGERAGNEFVYPKNQALMIARASGEPVMSVDSASSDIEALKQGSMSRITGSTGPPIEEPASTQPTTPQPAQPEPTAPPQTATPPTAAPASSDQNRPVGTSGKAGEELPRTASELPIVGLIGLIFLGGALTVRAARRRVV